MAKYDKPPPSLGPPPKGALEGAKPKSYINALKDRRGIEKIRFRMEDLLSQENLMNPDSVGVLQDMLNKYVHGEDKLKVDKILGEQTTKSIRQFRDESRYWGGHETIDIDPERTFRSYQGRGDKGVY